MSERVGIQEAPPALRRRFVTRLREPYPDPNHHRGLLKRLNPRSGEQIERVVPKHLAVYFPVPLAFMAFAALLVVSLFRWNPLVQFLLLISMIAIAVTIARAFLVWRDVFVLTNWRVVRLSGLLTSRVATMPINRILDMTMTRTPWGRILGYGHFVFESAAQEQGLREIKFVPNILAVDHEINNAVNKENRRRAKLGVSSQQMGAQTWQVEQANAPASGPDAVPSDVETTDPIRGL